MTTAYVGIGANLGDPKQQVTEATQALKASCSLIACSSLYQTMPIGWKKQPFFINAVVSLDFEGDPMALLQELQAIEIRMGRKRELVCWGEARVIDLDLLLFGSQVVNHPQLRVPHPYLKQRRFVLDPLFEIAPDLILPDGVPIASLMHAPSLLNQKIECIEKLAIL